MNVDSLWFAVTLLAILVGLRVTVYLLQRLARPLPAPAALTPDEPSDPSAVPSAVAETAMPATPAGTPVAADDRLATNGGAAAPADPEKQSSDTLPYRLLTELLDSAIIAVVLVFLIIRPFVLQAYYIPSGSMIPTLQVQDRVMATKYTYHMREPRRGEVVVFHAPPEALILSQQKSDNGQPVEFVKRVIGIPGDHIRIVRGDGVYINGVKLHEPYANDLPDYNFPRDEYGLIVGYDQYGVPREVAHAVRKQFSDHTVGDELIVPPGYLFMLGDNRTQSLDSHRWGLLKREQVIGKAVLIFWPWENHGIIR